MNHVSLVGRITKDPIIIYTKNGGSIAKFGIAVTRKFKIDGQPDADFLNCVAFNKTAEFIEKYFKKGDPIASNGRIQTGSYEKDGQRVYTADIIVEAVEFVPGRSGSNTGDVVPANEGFINVPDGVSEEGLPF